MKRHLLVLLLAGMAGSSRAQNAGIGTNSPDSSAQLDISSPNHGLLIPRMITRNIGSISQPAKGLMVYDSTQNQLMVNMGSAVAPDWENIAAPGGTGWNLAGNAGVNSSTQFIGTTDGSQLVFRTYNTFSGTINPNLFDTYLGYGCAQKSYNASLGYNFNSNSWNTAYGASSLTNDYSNYSSAFGAFAIDGAYQVNGNQQGTDNTAFGYDAFGSGLGNDNTAAGRSALAYENGSFNIVIGNWSLFNNSGGLYNTAIGFQALRNTSNSEYNTVIGYNSGSNYDNGWNNTILGANCDVSAPGLYNVIGIGQAVTCTAVSQARIGNAATNSIGGYANWTNFSDGRYKRNIKENVKGIDFIMRLRPLTYTLDVTGIDKKLSGGKKTVTGKNAPENGAMEDAAPENVAAENAARQKEAVVFSGFAAQEVEKAARDAGYDFSGVDKPKNENDFYGLRYGDFVVPLVKALQEQQRMIEAVQKKIDAMEKQVKEKSIN